jgi:hypothetical protein
MKTLIIFSVVFSAVASAADFSIYSAQAGVYELRRTTHDLRLDEACAVRVEHFQDANLVKVVGVANQKTGLHCSEQINYTFRCGFQDGSCRHKKIYLRALSPSEITIFSTEEDEEFESNYRWISNQEKPARVFRSKFDRGWSFLLDSEKCKVGNTYMDCISITEEIMRRNGTCEYADRLAVRDGMALCRQNGYSKCEVEKRDWSFFRESWRIGCLAQVDIRGF